MKKIKIISIFFVLLTCNLFSLNLNDAIKERKLPTYIIKDQSYISLNSLIDVIQPQSWGKIEDRVFIIYKGEEIKFRVGEDKIIFGNKTISINYPIKEIEGEILVPLDTFSNIFSQVPETKEENPILQKKIQEEEKSKKGNTYAILIDPGHGGKDTGAIGNFGLREKDVNLDVSSRLVDYLRKYFGKSSNVKVYQTRDEDVFLTLEERVQMASTLNVDMFFCVHTNSAKYNRADANGFETYYPRTKQRVENLPKIVNDEGILQDEATNEGTLSDILLELNTTNTIEESKILAEFVQEKLAERLLTPDRGAKEGNFYVLKYTPMVSVLVEIGFICNPNIELNLKDAEVRQAIAESLGNAIIEYLKSRKIIE